MKTEVAIELSFEGLIGSLQMWPDERGRVFQVKGRARPRGRTWTCRWGLFTLLEIKIDTLKCLFLKSNGNKLIAC